MREWIAILAALANMGLDALFDKEAEKINTVAIRAAGKICDQLKEQGVGGEQHET